MYEEDSENKIDKRTEIMDDVDEHEGCLLYTSRCV